MNILLIFFAIPLAVIILSAILETFIKCPYKTSGIFFSIFLVTAFALGGEAELLVATIIYTIISFITAYIVMIIRKRNNNTVDNNSIDYNEYSSLDNTYLRNNNNEEYLNTLEENNLIATNNNLLNNNFNTSSCKRYR